ncbi:sensor histidine kinase [Aequorivita marina]|uniref:sensor histidine kinase n=1 Tax=Aequorivita marina TaxID=3073654 RepID=UPI00287B99A5|nr:ATP-binding protein [Aequorivita sp. S2608]
MQDREKAKKAYDRELAQSQIEIREQTLRNISWELHDNIGQLMTLAKMQAQMSIEKPDMIPEVSETIGLGLKELRALSKLINPEALKSHGLVGAVKMEIERFNRLKFIAAHLEIIGNIKPIDDNTETILFRILQEFFSNTIKHSKALSLNVAIDYQEDYLLITAEDDGIGFDRSSEFLGIGLSNMKSRAALINAALELHAAKGEGTSLYLKYEFAKKDAY